MVAEGADIVDVGGESSRPGAQPVPEAEEMRRVLPVIEQLAEHVRVSVDTAKPAVARAAVAAGATLINDISASLAEVAAACGTGWVAMHMKGTPRDMQNDPRYADVVVEVRDFLAERAAGARRRGVSEVWIDPGIGFGKTVVHNLSLLAHCGELADLGYPLLVGTSRKSFLGRLFPLADGSPAPPGERIEASVATAVWAAAAGAAMVRVHDVAATVQALTIAGGEPDGDKRPDAPPPALAATGRLA